MTASSLMPPSRLAASQRVRSFGHCGRTHAFDRLPVTGLLDYVPDERPVGSVLQSFATTGTPLVLRVDG